MQQVIESAAALRAALAAGSGIHVLKLRALLELGDELKIPKEYVANLPPIEIGSITLVDQVVLVLFAKLIKPRKIVEIGTYKGFTTRLLLENTADDCEVVSIDLPREMTAHLAETDERSALTSAERNDDYLRKRQALDGETYLQSITDAQAERLTLVKHDSTKLGFKEAFGSAGMVFIDGGHERHIVEADTRNAFDIVESGVVVWHDFASNLHGDVSSYLADFSRTRAVFHVANSLVAFSFVNPRL